jgi:hypothetical protein
MVLLTADSVNDAVGFPSGDNTGQGLAIVFLDYGVDVEAHT